jgi:predicted transcriptional regulator
VGRIESGRVDPTVTTLSRLLRACEATLEVLPGSGVGVDRSLLARQLRRTPAERIADASSAARSLSDVFGSRS